MKFNIFGRQVYIKWQVAIPVFILVVTVIAGLCYYFNRNPNTITFEDGKAGIQKQADKDVQAEPSKIVDESEKEEIKIHVDGCVKSPGVITIKKGQIIDDAIKAAGGFTEDAYVEEINLAYELNENCKIKIKSKKEAAKMTPTNTQQSTSNSTVAWKGAEITKDSGNVIVNDNNTNGSNGTNDGKPKKVNLNTASAEELDTLPNVGEVTVKKIISYREKTKFKKIEEIMNIPGIGEKRFENLKDLITVD